MLMFKEQYNISSGIYYTFKNSSPEKLLNVNHSDKKIEKMSKIYNYNKYSEYSKQNYTILCLYINLKNVITSQYGMFELLNNISKEDEKYVICFKNGIIYYKRNIVKDLQFLKDRYNDDITYPILLEEYRKNKINWFTLWYYAKYNLDIIKLLNSRRYKKFLNKIKVLNLYINFDDESIKTYIKG